MPPQLRPLTAHSVVSLALNSSHLARPAELDRAGAATVLATTRQRIPRVFVLTFSDKKNNLYLHTLAASAFFFNDAPLYVLGLSGERSPRASSSGRWSIERRSISGTDPGKLKKLWFLGALLEQRHPLGMYDDDLLLFVDAFDVLLQRRLPTELPRAFDAFVRISRGQLEETASPDPDPEAVVVMGEHNCWPWPQPEVEGRLGSKRPRGVSMGYMRNATFK
ncbi:MAG: hypothetical protein SGPRY_009078, partial [Prymnesium sp.]